MQKLFEERFKLAKPYSVWVPMMENSEEARVLSFLCTFGFQLTCVKLFSFCICHSVLLSFLKCSMYN